MAIKNAAVAKKDNVRKISTSEHGRLSKWAKWWKANPKGLDIEILDWRAVVR